MVGTPAARDVPGEPGINICVGGYDGSVAGLSLETDADNLLSLTANFAYGAHIGAVRSAAVLGPTLVTGSVDETIRVYDLARRVERGTLFEHNGTVNALAFARDGSRDLLLSGGDDAALCVWRAADWRCLKRLVGHQAPVLDVAVHPSARVALSVAKDRALFMWNMLRGRVAFSAKTKGLPASAVEWSPEGEKYLLASEKTVTLSNVEGRSVTAFVHDADVLSSTFLDETSVATGGEEKVVRIWDARTPGKSVTACKHGASVRKVAFVDSLLMSADSTGGLKVWDVRVGNSPRLETSVGGGDMRLTCMTAASVVKRAPSLSEAVVEEKKESGGNRKSKRNTSGEEQDVDKRKRDGEASVPLKGTASQRKRKKRKKQQQA